MLALLTTGCASSKYGPAAHIKAVDRLAQIHEEYGSVTLSPPILIPPGGDGGYFKFDLSNDMSPKKYFDDAKNEYQGAAAVSNSSADVSSVGLSLQANLDQLAIGKELWSQYFTQKNDYLRQKAAYESSQTAVNNIKLEAARIKLKAALEEAKKKSSDADRVAALEAAYAQFAQDIPQPAAPGDAPKTPEFGDPRLPEVDKSLSAVPKEAQKFLQALELSKQLELLGSDGGAKTTNRDRTAIVTAAGDKTVEGIFRVLGQVDEVKQFTDKVTMYGVAMVSVQPGWRTKQGFEANLTVLSKLSYQKARKSVSEINPPVAISPKDANQPEEKYTASSCDQLENVAIPAAAAVSPMTDIQNLDSANSQRKAIERARNISLALSLFGSKVGAGAFSDYVQKMESDIRTRTPMIPVAAYSNGGIFGYRIGPSIAALTQPGNPDSTSGELLQKQSFPVLLVIGLDKSNLRPIRLYNGEICEPALSFDQTPAWVPLNTQAASHRLKETELVSLRQVIESSTNTNKCSNLDTLTNFEKKLAAIQAQINEAKKMQMPPEIIDSLNKRKNELEQIQTEGPELALVIQERSRIENKIRQPSPNGSKEELQQDKNKLTYLNELMLDLARVKSNIEFNKSRCNSQQENNKGKKADEDDLPDATKSMLMSREESLRHLVFGAVAMQDIPDLIFKKYLNEPAPPISVPAPVPEIEKVYLSDLNHEKGKLSGHIILTGKELKQIDCGKIEERLLSDKFKFVKKEYNDGGFIETDFTIDPKGGLAMLRLPIKGKDNEAILSPPIEIAPPSQPKAPDNTRAVVYSIGQDNGITTHRIEFGKKVKDKQTDIAKEVLKYELEKNKPALPPLQQADKCCKKN